MLRNGGGAERWTQSRCLTLFECQFFLGFFFLSILISWLFIWFDLVWFWFSEDIIFSWIFFSSILNSYLFFFCIEMFVYFSSTVATPPSLTEFEVLESRLFQHRSNVEEGWSFAGKAKQTRDPSPPTLHIWWRRQIYLYPIWD